MSSREKNMDRIFRSKLNQFNPEPPAEVWNNVNNKLNQDRRRKGIFWISRIAAGIAILTVLSLSYFLTRNAFNNKMITGEKSNVEEFTEESITDITGKQDEGKTAVPEYQEKQTAVIREISQPESEGKIAMSEKHSGTDDEMIAALTEPSLNFIRGKYIGQLEFEIQDKQIMPSESGKPGKALQEIEFPGQISTEDLYALNIPDEKSSKEGKWGIGTQVSPLYSYRNLDIDEKSLMSGSYYNETESGMMAYAGGINVNYVPTRRISMQSGVYYSKYGLSVDHAYYYENIVPDVSSSVPRTKFYSVNNSSGEIDVVTNSSIGYVTNWADRSAQFTNNESSYHSNTGAAPELSDGVDNGEIIQNFEYIEIPLIVRYKIIDRKVGLNLLGGLSTNLLVGSDAYYKENGNKEKIGETIDIKPFNYSSIIGAGVYYTISERFYINLEPTFRYYLNSINESSVIRSHPYSMGIFTGLSYYF